MAGVSSPRVLRAVSVALRSLVGLALVGAAAGIFGALYITRPTPAERSEEAPPLAVRTMTVAEVEVSRIWEGYGTARPMAQAEVAAQVSGRVVERPAGVEPGVRVARGDVLVRLDATDYEQRAAAGAQVVATLRADLDAWEIERARLVERVELAETEAGIQQRAYERLAAAGVSNEYEIEQRQASASRARREANLLREQLELMLPRRGRAEAMLAGAQADLRVAEENLARTVVRSPIDGVLQRVDANEGDFLPVGAPVARVVDLRRIEVPVRVPASAVRFISAGDSVELAADGRADREGRVWKGIVARIAPETDGATRTASVFVEVVQDEDNIQSLLLPGRFVVASVWSGIPEPRIVVPRSAVVEGRVMVVGPPVDGVRRANSRRVEIAYHLEGSFDGIAPGERQWAVVEAGLSPGEEVAVSNLDVLRDGTAVAVGGGAAKAGGGP